MQVISSPITIFTLETIAKAKFGNLVKAVVDIERGVVAIDADLHADEEAALLSSGSKQENLWGINLYPEFFGKDDFIEFDSMINLRPSLPNKTRGVDDAETRKKIVEIVNKLITP